MTHPIYQDFIQHVRDIYCLGTASSLLRWEQEISMPKKGLENRARQCELLSGIIHDRMTQPQIGEMLCKLYEPKVWESLTGEEQANVREMRRARERAVKIPKALVQEVTRVSTLSHEQWATARAQNAFAIFQPWLEKTVELQRQVAACLEFKNPYDALLDDYEPGMTCEKLDRLFGDLKKELIVLASWAEGECRKAGQKPIEGNFPTEKQKALCVLLLEKMGFDLESGRLDIAVHPFCSGMAGDVRLTTRYDASDFRVSFFGVIHEGGHGLYEQGFLPEHRNTPMGNAASLGIHESQSRFWENVIARGRPFWRHMLPVLQDSFPEVFAGVTQEQVFWWVNPVRPSLIRVEADEVTYHLHIILRYEMEQGMLKGDWKTSELPAVWNRKMKDYLGQTVPEDRLGILQDVHWSMGGIGYFPTYTLGSLYAAQWFHQLGKELPDLEDRIARGEWVAIRDWLRDKIHHQGSKHRADDLCRRITGEPLNPQHFTDYIRRKFA